MPKKRNQTAAAGDNMPFEQAIERVEAIVEAMESDTLLLEDMLTQYEEGARLLTYCQQRIDAAQQRIEVIAAERKSGAVSLKPFDSPTETGAETTAQSDSHTQPEAAPNPTTDGGSDAEAADEIRLF